jgi:plasmid stabilization system protein ParE
LATLRWSPRAVDELDSISSFLISRSPTASTAFAQRLASAIAQITDFPFSGRSLQGAGRTDFREIFVMGYRLVYQASDDVVTILAIQHGSRRFNLEDMTN